MKTLFLIPARGGSKGIPHKNRKLLGGRPLILYTLDAALHVADDSRDICVSTDDEELIKIVEEYGVSVPFKRPDCLAQDGSGTYEVILHALDYYLSIGVSYDRVVLLQPTSPFRTAVHIQEALSLYSSDLDMIVSVKETSSNPYYIMCRENEDGYLKPLLEGTFVRRQDCPAVYEYNGAVYVINVASLRARHISLFERKRKYVMPSSCSVDLDTPDDWKYAEFLMKSTD